jgi:hypothetical protein
MVLYGDACHIIKISSRSIGLNFKYPIKLNGFSKEQTKFRKFDIDQLDFT